MTELKPVRVESDDSGNHRIIAFGKAGYWTAYQEIAVLNTPEGLLMAVTDYFGRVLPTNQVLTVKPVGT